jgi:putative oxidoreductase
MDNTVDLLLATYPSLSMLIVRLGAGIVFFAHGAQKVFGWFGGPGLKATIQTFQQYMKIPPAATALSALLECFGGLALIVGLLARPTALGLIVVMLVAIAKVHWQHGFFINFSGTPGKGHGLEYNFVLMMMLLAILLAGAGVLSIDGALRPLGE